MSYDGSSLTYTVTPLATSKKFRFQYYATNAYGDSLPSATLTVAASTLPTTPAAPSIDWTQSSATSLHLTWTAVADPSSPVIGYILQVDEDNSGSFSTIFDGSY
jgi:hypothetical protein